MSLWTMGLNQSARGTWNVNALCNLHLATGQICRPGSGPFSLTGQPNAMGGREVGYMSGGLPGYRHVASAGGPRGDRGAVGIAPGSIGARPGLAAVDFSRRWKTGRSARCGSSAAIRGDDAKPGPGPARARARRSLWWCRTLITPRRPRAIAHVLLPGACGPRRGRDDQLQPHGDVHPASRRAAGRGAARLGDHLRRRASDGLRRGFPLRKRGEIFDGDTRSANPVGGLRSTWPEPCAARGLRARGTAAEEQAAGR